MRQAATRGMTRPILFVALAGLALAGCDEKLSGTYLSVGNKANPQDKMVFGSGETVDIFTPGPSAGTPIRATYKIEGKKVTITIPFGIGMSIVFIVDDKGCLDSISEGKYCKK